VQRLPSQEKLFFIVSYAFQSLSHCSQLSYLSLEQAFLTGGEVELESVQL